MDLGAPIRCLVTHDSCFQLRNVGVTSERVPPGARREIQHVYWYQLMEFILSVIIITVFFSMLAAGILGILGFITALIIAIVANAKRLNGIDPNI